MDDGADTYVKVIGLEVISRKKRVHFLDVPILRIKIFYDLPSIKGNYPSYGKQGRQALLEGSGTRMELITALYSKCQHEFGCITLERH